MEPIKVLTEEGIKALYGKVTSDISVVENAKLDKNQVFVGTMAEYEEKNALGEIPVGALVFITE